MSPTSDDTGRSVALPGAVRRVVSLVPSLTEAVAVSAPGLLVGATDWCSHPADLDVARVRGTKNPDVDAVLALAPDLVLANAEENREVDLQALRDAGVAVWTTYPRTVPEAVTSLQRALAACGVALPPWLRVAALVWEQPWRGPRRRAVVPIWRRPWMAVGRDTFTGDVLARLGVDNALGEDPERYPRFSPPGPDGVDLVVLPDEPYLFTPEDGPEAFPGLESRCVSGRDLTWYGPSLTEARASLAAALHDRAGAVAGALLGEVRSGPVALAEPDGAWSERGAVLAARLGGLLGVEVQHVGSTSVPGLLAKPVLDLQAGLPDLDSGCVALLDDGWTVQVVEPRHRVLNAPGGEPAVNLHLHPTGDPALTDRLRLRDRLRADEDARHRYASLKRSLAGRDWPDVDAYADAKGPLVRELLG